LENGVSTVAQTSLVGATNYVKALNLVANESYPDNFTQGTTVTVAGVAGARTVTYSP
jgi:type IV pilus assembly protein PilA